ncbi:MAG: hypothetical protein BWY50_01906 [Spirochaetes bacterium ADurb.Bin315]|nr:MAG: hypothetical protein BWY50_01906 [Spirochaetes bacterium ADurb.Bin315]
MFLRISGHTDREVGRFPVLVLIIQIPSVIEIRDLLDKLARVGVPVGHRNEALLPAGRIAPEGEDIVYSKKVQLDEGILDLLPAHPSADHVSHRRDVERVLDKSSQGGGAGTLAHRLSLKKPIFPLQVDDFRLVVRHVDIGGIELHQGSNRFQDRLEGPAFERRNQFEGEKRFLGGLDDFGYTHGSVSHILQKGGKLPIGNAFSPGVPFKLGLAHIADGEIPDPFSADDRSAHR